MDAELRVEAESIPSNPQPWSNYHTIFMRILKWSVENKEDELRSYLAQETQHFVFRDLLIEFVKDRDMASFSLLANLVVPLKVTNIAHEALTLLTPIRTDIGFRMLKGLLEFRYSPENLQNIEDSLVDLLGNRKTFKKLLDIMMDNPQFPVPQPNNALSAAWYKLLSHLIRSSKFVEFRKIIGDWERFGNVIDLCEMGGPGSRRIRSDHELPLSLIEEALTGRIDVFIWFLLTRPCFFEQMRNPFARGSGTGHTLFKLIPELKTIKWDTIEGPMEPHIASFFANLNESRADEFPAQTGLLCTPDHEINIEVYIQTAIKDGSQGRIEAALYSGNMKTEHPHLLFMAKDKLDNIDNVINKCIGYADIATLQYDTKGLVMILFAQRHSLFNRRALRLFEMLFTNIGQVKIVKVFRMLDKIFETNELESALNKDLMVASESRAASFSKEPRNLTDPEEAFDLLMYYHDTRKSAFANELICSVSNDLLLGFFEASIEIGEMHLVKEMLVVLQKRYLNEELYSVLRRTSGAKPYIVHKILTFKNFGQDQLLYMLTIAATRNNESFFNFVLDTIENIPTATAKELLELILTTSPNLFKKFWKNVRTSHLANFCIRLIITKDLKAEPMNVILGGKYLPSLCEYSIGLVTAMIKAERFDLIAILFQSIYVSEIDWSLSDNNIFDTALEVGNYECCRLLLRDVSVFVAAMANKTEAFKAMFPELADEEATEFTSIEFIHRRFVRLSF